jgi:hypothetical protein
MRSDAGTGCASAREDITTASRQAAASGVPGFIGIGHSPGGDGSVRISLP